MWTFPIADDGSKASSVVWHNILAPAMDVMGIRATARHEPLDLARKVLRKAPLFQESQTPEVELAVLTAQAQSERDVRHKSLLLPAVLALPAVSLSRMRVGCLR